MRKHIITTLLVMLCVVALSSCGSSRRAHDPRLDLRLENVRPGMAFRDVMMSPYIKFDLFDTEFEMESDSVLVDKLIFRKDTWNRDGVIGINWTKLIFRNGILVQKTSRFEALPARLIDNRDASNHSEKKE